jgi:hypothetical protein
MDTPALRDRLEISDDPMHSVSNLRPRHNARRGLLYAYRFSITGTANCHCRFSRALCSVSNGPSVQLYTASPFMVLESTKPSSASTMSTAILISNTIVPAVASFWRLSARGSTPASSQG